ncbi:MAG: TIGR02221 family CRISPR-associated protein [Chromatiaceae bacterium]|nr:TIGR02221 family CRISPR-associated protein [Chromatiaceae bacterium]
MKTTLVSFLGKNTGDPKTGYRTATYRFADGHDHVTPFFGLALARDLNPDLMVILGTSGSMWDVLIEHLAEDEKDEAAEETRLELMEAVRNATVDAALLQRVQPLAERHMARPLILRLIPYGRDDQEQAGILQAIAAAVPPGRVHIDLTHGFRHLAALGLLSAFFLECLARLKVSGLYYGALDMTRDGVTPVLRLDGLLAIQRWIDALDRFDQSGDYGVFAPLLVADGIAEDKARCLEDAAFHERTFNLSGARRKLMTFLPLLDAGLPGSAALFQNQMKERLAWARESDLAVNQQRLAYLYLDRRDYARAAIFGWESLITRECGARGYDSQDYRSGREPATDALDAEVRARAKRLPPDWITAYWTLKSLRNGLAHGNPASVDQVRKIIASPTRLPDELRRAFDRLLN